MLADRDLEILCALSVHVRLFSLQQISEHWWPSSPSALPNARRRLAGLVDSGHLERIRFPVRPLPPLDAPLITWSPSLPSPDYEAVSWKLKSRWTEAPKATTTYIATARAANLFGGHARGRLKRSAQASHDLGVSAVYLRFRNERPAEAALWIGEDLLAHHRRHEKIPDAVISTAPENKPQLVIEFGGAYEPARVRAFHLDCKKKRLPYELW